MQERYRLYCRSNGIYYLEDGITGKQESARTKDLGEARQVAAARNQAAYQPALNLLMAKTYLQGKSPELLTRTWDDVLKDIEQTYHGNTKDRWQRFAKSRPLELIRAIPLAYTEASHLLAVLRHPKAGTSTNVWLRRLHNYAMNLGWLLAPVLSPRAWPPIRYKTRFAVTAEEHQQIIASEHNPERRSYYQMLWETGGAQSDIALLTREHVDMEQKIICFQRHKLAGRGFDPVQLRMGERILALLAQLPDTGLLFPRISAEQAKHRASEFKRRCTILGIKDRTLHSYRYAWAERACQAGMPEREAMAHLGHKSPAVHRAYARKAKVVTMPLEHYEQQKAKVLEYRPELFEQKIA